MNKISALRKYETYCYQVSYYMLEDEEMAVEAVSQAFIHLYQQETFFSLNEEEQRSYLKHNTIQQSLDIYKKHMLQQRHNQHVS